MNVYVFSMIACNYSVNVNKFHFVTNKSILFFSILFYSIQHTFTTTNPGHDYCALNYAGSEVDSASDFTLFVNNGGLQIPSVVHKYHLYTHARNFEYAEKVFKANVQKDEHQITIQERLEEKHVMEVCDHFI